MSAARLRAPLDMQGNEDELLRDFAAPGDASLAFTFDCGTVLVSAEAAKNVAAPEDACCVAGKQFLL